jgi:hypothetical protein
MSRTAKAAAFAAAIGCHPLASSCSFRPSARSLMPRMVNTGTDSFSWPARAAPALSISIAAASS